MGKLTIISIFDLNEDFIKLQYNSIKKNIKCDHEYIIFNNAKENTQKEKIQKICDELQIECIDLISGNGGPSDIAGIALNNAFLYLKEKEYVFKIDSDMFFINDVDLLSYIDKYDIIYIPNTDNTIIWSGVFGFSNKILNNKLNFLPVRTIGDTFCESKKLLENKDYSRFKFELFNLIDYRESELITNYNTDCVINYLPDGEISHIEKPHYLEMFDLSNNFTTYKRMYKMLSESCFPEPFVVDLIMINNKDFIFHFKSGNWSTSLTEQFINDKKEGLKKLLKKYESL